MKSLRSSDPARPMDITQSYRSDDPVQNLKVRVTLRCIAGAFPGRNTQEAKDADKAGHDADAGAPPRIGARLGAGRKDGEPWWRSGRGRGLYALTAVPRVCRAQRAHRPSPSPSPRPTTRLPSLSRRPTAPHRSPSRDQVSAAPDRATPATCPRPEPVVLCLTAHGPQVKPAATAAAAAAAAVVCQFTRARYHGKKRCSARGAPLPSVQPSRAFAAPRCEPDRLRARCCLLLGANAVSAESCCFIAARNGRTRQGTAR